eukprot:86922_1
MDVDQSTEISTNKPKHQQKQADEEKKSNKEHPEKQVSAATANPFKKLQYFIYITEIKKENFTINVNVQKKDKRHRNFVIKESNTQRRLGEITIESKQKSGKQILDFDNDSTNIYTIALYDKKSNKKLSQEIKLTKYPSIDLIDTYKPNCIDPSSIIEIKKKQNIHLYWNSPLSTFGKIKYKINYHVDGQKTEQEIESFPYLISSTLLPIKIQIITISVIDHHSDNNDTDEDDNDTSSDEESDENDYAVKTYYSDPISVQITGGNQMRFIIDYIHVEDSAINMEFDQNINFANFKKTVLNELKIKDSENAQIAYIGKDRMKAHIVIKHNFKSILSSLKTDGTEMFLVGFYPETPKIKQIYTYIKNELNITLSSKNVRGNTFCLDLNPTSTEIETKEEIQTKAFDVKISINSDFKYKIRVKAENIFGVSSWSDWMETHLPLHKFTTNDLCNKIQQWVDNDINYMKALTLFKSMSGISLEEKVKESIGQYVTDETLNIIYYHLNELDIERSSIIRSKPAEEMYDILYDFPVKRLIEEINKNKIGGEEMINILEENQNNMVHRMTGWSKTEIEQFKLVLFKDMTFTEIQLIE